MNLTAKQKLLLEYVKDCHGDQKRKYTGEPYWNHVYAVAEIVSFFHPEALEIALCHDLLEDTFVDAPELLRSLISIGYSNEDSIRIVSCVNDLTDVYTKENFPKLNRKERKKLESERLGKVNFISQSIKYADLIDNTKSIVEHDSGFAKVYLSEKRDILNQMRDGNPELLRMCEEALQESYSQLKG